MNLLDRLNSSEAEQSVIGAALISPESIDSIGALRPEHCYTEAHRIILAEIMAMVATGQPVDVLTVAENLDAKGLSERTGGLAYLGQMASSVATSKNIRRYADIVVGKALERQLVAAADSIRGIVAETGTTKDKLTKAQAEVMRITESVSSKQPRRLSEVMVSAVDVLSQRNNGEVPGLKTGYADLDDKLSGGFKPGNLIIVAGRPGMGKTALSSNIAHNVAEGGKNVLFLSMEMTEQELFDRLIASSGRVNLSDVIEGKMDGLSGDRIMAGFSKLQNVSMWIDDQSALTLFDVASKARSVKRKHGLDLLVIDYLQLMSGEGASRNQEIETISRGLKALAKELAIPVICLSQLSRKCEERTNKRPMPSDLRESGAIEQDADLIIFVYRDEIYDPASADRGTAEVIIAKNRQGSTGAVRMAYIGEYTRFEPLASGWQPDEKPVKKASRGFHV